MATKLKYNMLTKDQTHFLIDFIKTCLPEKEDEAFTTNNELRFASVALHRIFKKHFGFSLSIRNILYAFEKNNYTIYLKKGDEITIKAEKESEKEVKPNFSLDLHSELGVDAIYVKIDSKKIHNYIRAAYDLPPTAKDKKVDFIDKVIENLKQFKLSWDANNPPVV